MSNHEDTDFNNCKETFIKNSNNQKLFCRYWGDDAGITKPSGIVFISHGAAEHCLWYNDVAAKLAEKNLYVFSHDHIGHGQSEGDRVHIDDFKFYNQDVFYHVEMIKKKFPDVPCFIIGHSMGGAIAIMTAIERPTFFKGVVLIAPAIIPSPDAIQPWKIQIGKVLARLWPQAPVVKLDTNNVVRDPVMLTAIRILAWFFPKLIFTWVDENLISRSKKLVKKYQEDPLVYHGGLKAKWGLCLLNALQHIESKLSTIQWPYLLLHGDLDKLCNLEGSKEMHEKSVSSDKTFKIYEGYFHQLHHEPGNDGAGVREEILTWITNRL